MKYITTRLITALIFLLLISSGNAQETGLGRHKRMFAVPAPDKVAIDGRLDEWDMSGAIEMYVMKATADMQSARFAIMYDAEALYLGAEIKDSTPLLNRNSPEANALQGWNADSCQFRIVTDPAAGPSPNFGKFAGDDRGSGRVAHLTMWYYTDRQEPVLQAALGMDYTHMPGSLKDGVIPRDGYQAAYRMGDDKCSYSFEYRIPWSTLAAKVTPKAGDVLGATVQFNFSDATGLKTGAHSAWAYDLMSGPGFPFQSTACWGKLLLSKEGKLPRELVEEGLPPVKQLPLTLEFTMPEEGEVSLALMNSSNEVVRTLASASPRPAGPQVERWDGCDEAGNLLPAGTYAWKGLYHQPLKMKYVLSVHNSGKPAYKTDDGKGSWGGDHGVPSSVCVAGDRVYLGWNSAEAGSGLIATDFAGRKQWGVNSASPMYLTTDGRNLFTFSREGADRDMAIKVLSAKDGGLVALSGKAGALVPPGEPAAVSGLACDGTLVYASYATRNLIVAYDAQSGAVKSSWDMTSPGALAIAKDGALLATSEGKVVAMKEGKVSPLISDCAAAGLAVDAQGLIYASLGGKRQNVSVFAPDGKYLRSIGKEGGRPAMGRYKDDGMLSPFGLSVTPDGRLWVMECSDSPKRISVWDTQSGALVKEFFGAASYAAHIGMDPERPDEVYCDGVIWKVDLDKKTSFPFSTVWRPANPNSPGMFAGPRLFTARNGKQYAFGWEKNRNMVLSIREDDHFRPLLAFIWKPNHPALAGDKWPVKPGDPQGGTFPWVDTNGDMTIQADELGPRLGPSWYRGFTYVDQDLNLWHPKGELFRPLRIEPDGRPVYDFSKPEKTVPSVVGSDPDDGSLYQFSDAKPLIFGRVDADKGVLWRYSGLVSWKEALGLPPQQPGKLWGPTAFLGVAGDFTGMATYFGCHHLYTRDGLSVGMIFRDPRQSLTRGPEHIMCENQFGQLVKPKGMDRYFALGGEVDGRITEILGLETVKRLKGGTYELTPPMAQQAAKAVAEYESKKSADLRVVMVRGKAALAKAQGIEKSSDKDRSFRYQMAYDETNLYFLADVNSPTPLLNAITDDRMVFKGGNLIDIQLAANPAADGQRQKPAAGDLRILASMRNGKPIVVVYRPVVKGFAGEKIVLNSPTGKEEFDVIERTDRIGVEYAPKKGVQGFTALVTIPLDLIGFTPKAGEKVKMDLGYIFGNPTGTQAAQRSYWRNNGFSANVLNDVPNEARLEPAQWGEVEVE